MRKSELTRRDLLRAAGGFGLAGVAIARGREAGAEAPGQVVGQPIGGPAGVEVLRSGGNAVDAIVTAALVAAVVAPHHCGIGGYGGHMVIALPGEKKVTAIDFNGTAPAAARADMFPLDERGQVRGGVNFHGWLAAGVPGTLAGMQLALDRYGTRSFAEAVQPAIRFAQEGFPAVAAVVSGLRGGRARILADPGSARLLLPGGEAPEIGGMMRNPDLAAMLRTLAGRGSVESFYRGDIAVRIAAAFRKNGGLVTAADMAAYRAREVEPLRLEWGAWSVRTAPLTAGGATVLQALNVLKALDWENLPAGDPKTTQALLETLRLAWGDRLTLLGDPDHGEVPLARLLSDAHAGELADRARAAVRDGKPVPVQGDDRKDDGTVNLSAVDGDGLMVALTLTHGGYLGAQVTVDGLGLTLGHGMSRFDPRPGRPNSPGPRKRPLHNMCPTVVLRGGRPALALGGAGGRKIPNSVCEVLAQYVCCGATLEAALAAPRIHTEGGLQVTLGPNAPAADEEYLRKVGYDVTRGAAGANVSAVEPDR